MTTLTKQAHTPGAMRAAERLLAAGFISAKQNVEYVAEHISRETGDAEMLEALEDLLRQMDEWKTGKGAGSLEYWAGPGKQKVDAAIRKAKGEL